MKGEKVNEEYGEIKEPERNNMPQPLPSKIYSYILKLKGQTLKFTIMKA